MSKAKREDRMAGAVYGLAVGSALGGPVNGKQRGFYPWVRDYQDGGPFELRAGQWGPSMSSALAVAYAMIRTGNQTENIVRELRAWYEHGKYSVTGHCFGITGSTQFALFYGPQNQESACDYSPIARLAPAVLIYQGLGYSSIEAGCSLSSMATQGHQRCYGACRLLGGVIARFIHGYSLERVLGAFIGRRLDFGDPSVGGLADLRWLSETGYSDLVAGSCVVSCLRSGLYCAMKAETFDEALQLAANLGGETEAVCAVTGQVAGARWGYSGIPARWITDLDRKDMIDHAIAIIHEFRVRQGAPGTSRR